MKILLLHDYSGELTDEIFLCTGEHEVTVAIGVRLIEHGMATAVVDEAPKPNPKPSKPKRG